MKTKNKHVKHLPKSSIAEAFGWVGASAILIDYALLSLDLLGGDSILYHIVFLLGSAGLALVTFRHRAFQSFTVNLTFIVLAIIALCRIVFFA